jgi:hypothetical protein
MDSIYQNLNKKNWTHYKKHKPRNDNNKETTKHAFYTQLVNFTHVKFNNDQINTLNLDFDYAIERNQK